MNSISNWNNGIQDGIEKGYFQTGSIEYFGTYHLGNKDSIWTWYNQDGTIDQIEQWNNGKLVSLRK